MARHRVENVSLLPACLFSKQCQASLKGELDAQLKKCSVHFTRKSLENRICWRKKNDQKDTVDVPTPRQQLRWQGGGGMSDPGSPLTLLMFSNEGGGGRLPASFGDCICCYLLVISKALHSVNAGPSHYPHPLNSYCQILWL